MIIELLSQGVAIYGGIVGGWLVVFAFVVVTCRQLLVLNLQSPKLLSSADEPQFPLVSIIIPARNEERNIEICIRSALALDYPNLQILVADDRSTDRTAEIIESISNEDPRVRLIRVHELPAGWAGKPHALHTASSHASGEWLLFLDADTMVHAQNLRVALAYAQAEKVDVLSMLSAMRCETFWERAIQPLASIGLMLFFKVPNVNDDRRPKSALASGQYIFMKRTAYDRIGGHVAVRDKLMEDIAIAQLTKRNGLRLRLVSAPELTSTRMYATPSEMLRGWSRIYFGAVGSQTWKLYVLAAATVVMSLSAFLMTAGCICGAIFSGDSPGLRQLALLNVAHHVLIVVATTIPWRQAGGRARDLWAYCVACAMVLAFLLRAIRMTFTQKVTWRGVTYGQEFQQQVAAHPIPQPVVTTGNSPKNL